MLGCEIFQVFCLCNIKNCPACSSLLRLVFGRTGPAKLRHFNANPEWSSITCRSKLAWGEGLLLVAGNLIISSVFYSRMQPENPCNFPPKIDPSCGNVGILINYPWRNVKPSAGPVFFLKATSQPWIDLQAMRRCCWWKKISQAPGMYKAMKIKNQ